MTAIPSPPDNEAPISFVDSRQQLGAARSWQVSLGDLDGDSDLDAFVVNDSHDIAGNAVWLNDGHGIFSLVEQDLGYGRGGSLGDLDQDGDLDAFITDWENPSNVWLNDGSGYFTDSGQSIGQGNCWGVALGDLDGDGDLDAMTAQDQANLVWLNDGDGIFTDSGQRLGVKITAELALGDLDGDGDLDALAGGWGEPAKVWFNDGISSGIFVDSGQSLTSKYLHIHGLALGDLDNDGDLDGFLAIAGEPNQVWTNDGSGTFVDSGQQLGAYADNGVALGDLDGDGDLDAFITSAFPKDQIWLNEGGIQDGTTGVFIDSGLVLGDLYSLKVALGDLDGDGDLDAFVTHGNMMQSSGGGQPNQVWFNQTP